MTVMMPGDDWALVLLVFISVMVVIVRKNVVEPIVTILCYSRYPVVVTIDPFSLSLLMVTTHTVTDPR